MLAIDTKRWETDASRVKPSDQFGVTIFVGGILVLAGLGAHVVGMPPVLGAVCVLLGILILVDASYRLKKARVRGPDTHGAAMPPEASLRARVRFFWFVAFGLVLGTVLLIPILPYVLGDSSPQMLYAVVPAQILVVAAFLAYFRRRLFNQRDGNGEEGA